MSASQVVTVGFKETVQDTQRTTAKDQPWEWSTLRDARIPFAALLTLYCVLGFTFLGFNRSPFQMLTLIMAGCLLDMGCAWLLQGRRLIPLSASISCCSLGLLLNYSHGAWLLLFPVYMTICSKYVLTFHGRHVFNPSLFGVCTSLLLTNELVTAAPAYQWAGGNLTMSAFVVMAALSLFVFRVGRGWLIVSFLFFYMLQTALRAYLMRYHIPAEMLLIGTLTSPPFFLFTFYMMTDPATSPQSRGAQVLLGFGVAAVDLYLHTKESVFTFFYAAFLIATGKFIYLHLRELLRVGPRAWCSNVFTEQLLRRWLVVLGLGASATCLYLTLLRPYVGAVNPGFSLERLDSSHTGIETEMSQLLTEVDPRVAHIAKWVMSVGDAVAVGDVDNDGLMDLFLTNLLKAPQHRHALYRNLGNLQFERLPLPALDIYRDGYKQLGLPAGATFVDYDGDGDQDLALAVGFGPSRILKNELREKVTLSFVVVTDTVGLDEHTVSLAITFFDMEQDGHLDMLILNAMAPTLQAYKEPCKFNIFALPEPEYDGDRRMFFFMHNGWHNADNGGPNAFYQGRGDGAFVKKDIKKLGIDETRWSLAVATGDLNRDGFTDLYIANDFGPDHLYLNDGGKRFVSIKGRMFGEVGRDTYKGMNSTFADFDRNGYLDIYVSNVHHILQAEGSLLWMTRPTDDPFRPSFTDEATQRGALNERRFGWGADAGDLNNDGWVDLVQANGMVDDRLDHMYESHKDYWYVNHKLMQSAPEIHTYADMWGDIRGRTLYPNEARRAYLNMGAQGSAFFVDVAAQVGIADPDNSRGVALADFDNDGDLDLVITNQHGPVSIYRNTLRDQVRDDANFIGLSLTGNGRDTHRSAIGTQVVFRYEEGGKAVEQLAEVSLLSGFSSQGDPRLHVGLGRYSGPVDVTIKWYGAKKQHLRLEPNRYHVVEQPQ
jgi:hypothetical protein